MYKKASAILWIALGKICLDVYSKMITGTFSSTQ